MKEELQQCLNRINLNSTLYTPYSIGAKFYLRFELGKGYPNGTIERVNQAVERAMKIVDHIFKDLNTNLYVLAYEYEEDFSYPGSKYLHKQINVNDPSNVYETKEMINSRTIITDENGVQSNEKTKVDLSIYKIQKKDVNFENILKGIANMEMGFEPKIYEEVYFFDRNKNIIFNMYDDRGCFVFSNDPENLRELYETKNDWIVDYDRPTIDKQFLKD